MIWFNPCASIRCENCVLEHTRYRMQAIIRSLSSLYLCSYTWGMTIYTPGHHCGAWVKSVDVRVGYSECRVTAIDEQIGFGWFFCYRSIAGDLMIAHRGLDKDCFVDESVVYFLLTSSRAAMTANQRMASPFPGQHRGRIDRKPHIHHWRLPSCISIADQPLDRDDSQFRGGKWLVELVISFLLVNNWSGHDANARVDLWMFA